METLNLSEGCDECKDVPELCSVGKILAPEILNRTAVSNILESTWKPRSKLVISLCSDNVYMFQFADSKDRSKVLDEAPWSVMGNHLILQPLHLGMAVSDFEFRWCPFWVQVYGLPLDKMTKTHGVTIGNNLGKLIKVEALSDGLLLGRSFLRIRVEIDVTKPLLQGFILHRRNPFGEAMDDVRILYKYEKLSEFFYDCGRIGHDNTSCNFTFRDDGATSKYGPDMRTGLIKHIGVHPDRHQTESNADLARRSERGTSSKPRTTAGGGIRGYVPATVGGVLVRCEREEGDSLSCMPAQESVLLQGDTCLPTSADFMDLSLNRKALHEDLPTVRHPKLLKWDGLDDSVDKVERKFSLGAQSKVAGKEKKARSSGRKVRRPKKVQLVDVVVGNSESDMVVFSAGFISIKSPKPANNSVSFVKDVINPTLKDWDHRKISSLVSREEHDAIALIWHYNFIGSYTIKSGYQCALRLTADLPANIPSSSTQWCDSDWKFAWSLNLPPKLKHFVWRVCNNFLAAKQNLYHRCCSTSDMCQVCSQSSESIKHVFFGCAWTKAV
ncbi:putative ribonuclease H protein [Camellia lanceoleosa]|uniref:Ribonuclease H protein n=1 Tax=Camellia lanceoleosa TaxID=1840588 RepID=A0ACC0I1T8_9ERIC|nr:putative ribonuclease H protein [Camellia lanceoleosa]